MKKIIEKFNFYSGPSISKVISVAVLVLLVFSMMTGFVIGDEDTVDEEIEADLAEEGIETNIESGGGSGDLKSVTLQPNATVGKDNLITTEPPWDEENLGTYNTLMVGNGSFDYRTLIEFELPDDSSVRLDRATLSMYAYSTTGDPVNITVHPLMEEWVEGEGNTVTNIQEASNWTYRTDSEKWSDGGAEGDYDESYASYRRIDKENIWVTWDVTSIVNAWITGVIENNGFILLSDNPNPAQYNFVDFVSSDYTDSTLHPKLTISYATQIDPPVPNQTMNEDDPTRTISLRDREHETIVNVSGRIDSENSIPFAGGYSQCHFQTLYTPGQIGTSGVIHRISFNRSYRHVGNFSNMKISFAHTGLDELTNTFADNYEGDLVEVFKATEVELNSSNGDSWVHFDLNGNFTYDTSYNLLLDLIWEGAGSQYVAVDSTSFPGTVRRIYSWTDQDTGTTSPYNTVCRFETEPVKEFTSVSGPSTGFNNAIPFWGGTADLMHYQTIYTPDQVGAEGHIKRISFQRSSTTTYGNFSDFQISFAHTQLNEITGTFADNYAGYPVEVFPKQEISWDSSYDDIWIHFDLNDNFTYDNAHNLLIDITWEGDGDRNIVLKMTQYSDPIRVHNIDDINDPTGANQSLQPVAQFETDIIQNAVVDKGTSGTSWPFYQDTEDEMRLQMLHDHTLIKETGIIDKLHFQGQSSSSQWGVYENLSIRIAHSKNSTLDNNYDQHNTTPWVEVFNKTSYNITYEGDQEWIEFDIEDEFYYNGDDNLVIDVRWRGAHGDTIHLAMNKPASYDCLIASYDYNADVAEYTRQWLYNLQAIFLHERDYSWMAFSSDESLFTTETTGDCLDGWDLHITPQPDAYGTGTLTLRLHNSQGKVAFNYIQVTINPVNDAPTLSAPSTITCDEDIDKVIDMSSYADDIDNVLTELSFSTNSSYATVDEYNITFNYPNGVLSEIVEITVEDPGGLSDHVIVEVSVEEVNDPPELSGPDEIDYVEDVDHVLDMSSYASDVDNEIEELTFATNSSYATVEGYNITFNYPNGVLSEVVNITVEDPGGLSDYSIVQVTVEPVNDPPDLSGVPDIQCNEGEDYVLDMSSYASDIDNDLEELTFDTNSSYATINGAQIIFNYTGRITAEVVNTTVEDPGGLSDYEVIQVTVNLSEEYPNIESHQPTGSGTSPYENIVVEFNMAMDTDTAESSFTLTREGTDISGTFSWNTEGTRMTFDPTEELDDGNYTATVTTTAQSTEGTNLPSEHTWTFSVSTEDSDGDGMTDAWEIEYGLDPDDPSDADEDSDGDGVSNLQEYLDGTDPTDVNDFLIDDEEGEDGDGKDDGFLSAWILLLIAAVIIALILVVVIMNKKVGEEDQYLQQEPEEDAGTSAQDLEEPPKEPSTDTEPTYDEESSPLEGEEVIEEEPEN